MNPLDYLSNDGRWWLGTAVLAMGLMAALVWYFRQVSLAPSAGAGVLPDRPGLSRLAWGRQFLHLRG